MLLYNDHLWFTCQQLSLLSVTDPYSTSHSTAGNMDHLVSSPGHMAKNTYFCNKHQLHCHHFMDAFILVFQQIKDTVMAMLAVTF